MISVSQCPEAQPEDWFIETLFKDYRDLLYVLAWVNWCGLSFGCVICGLFWFQYPSFRKLNNYVFFNLFLSLSMFNFAKIFELFSFEQASVSDKQTAVIFSTLSMGWYASWVLLACVLGVFHQPAKIIYNMNHKYWKTNVASVVFALMLTISATNFSRDDYPVAEIFTTMPVYFAYLVSSLFTLEKVFAFPPNDKQWLNMFIYKTGAILALASMHLDMPSRRWVNFAWMLLMVLQMFTFVFYLATGDMHRMHIKYQKEKKMKPIVSDDNQKLILVTVLRQVK